MVNIGNSWDSILAEEFKSDYYLKLREFLKNEYSTRRIYPDMHNIFNAFKLTAFEDVKIVILGQDPYHEEGQAQGLCFAVPADFKKPPSLQNMYKELEAETGIKRESGSLEGWGRQGVLLLNAVMTVRAGSAGSHAGKGWEIFTDHVIEKLNERQEPVIFLLWGGYARKKKSLITNPRHFVFESAHPSPLSAYNGYFGNGHYLKANEVLIRLGKDPIDWSK